MQLPCSCAVGRTCYRKDCTGKKPEATQDAAKSAKGEDQEEDADHTVGESEDGDRDEGEGGEGDEGDDEGPGGCLSGADEYEDDEDL